MKKFLSLVLVATALISMTTTAHAGRVRGYYKKNGTYVQPHYRSNPNRTKLDNYSTRGNINPYTGKKGTKDPYNYNSGYGSGSYNYNNNTYNSGSSNYLGD